MANYFLPNHHFNLGWRHKKESRLIIFLLSLKCYSLCLSCLPTGLCSTKPIYHAQNWSVSLEPMSCSLQFFFAFLTLSFLSHIAMVSFFIILYYPPPPCNAVLKLFTEHAACLTLLTLNFIATKVYF